jgi:hypothetical protein
MSPELAGACLQSFQEGNARLERSAILLPRNVPTFRLQVERILREAKHPYRRVCKDTAEAKAWLSSCLDSAEQIRLDEFLASMQ